MFLRTLVLIVVLLGTNPYNFSRLAQAADEYARASGKEVFIQMGHTDYVPSYATCEKFLSKGDLLRKIDEAEVVITQGGFGSIADCLLAGKNVVAVPRKPELKEAPDCQEELVRELERLGRLIGVYDIKDLPRAIEMAAHREVTKGNGNNIPNIISRFLEEM
jgi:UDP-N-acetylglucosamine transferase subunit ALG13